MVMKISIVMLIFLFFRTKMGGGQNSVRGEPNCLRGAPPGRKPEAEVGVI